MPALHALPMPFRMLNAPFPALLHPPLGNRSLSPSPLLLPVRRRARFKRSNSVTAGVQADLELEGFAGLAVATEDKALQFGRPFQRHSSEPESTRQYAVYKTVHTQGQWAYREDYQMQYDTVEVPRRDSWIDRGSRSLPDSGRASPCHRDGEWFIKLLQAEVEKMEGWCQQMEREAEDYDLPEESESRRGGEGVGSIQGFPPGYGASLGWVGITQLGLSWKHQQSYATGCTWYVPCGS